jgi:NAD(P)-dependent dehydrogenase (short-subunit alcohol dehydrogenase family)
MSKSQRTYVITGAASGIGLETKRLLESQGHRVIGADLLDADVIADLGSASGRDALVNQVTALSGGAIDAVLAVAGVDAHGPVTAAVNYYGAIATLEGLRPLMLASTAPRAVAVSSITSVHPYDTQLLNALLDGSEALALEKAAEEKFVYATSKRALSRWIRRNALKPEWAGANIPLNAIAPGLVKTELLKRLFDDPATRKRIIAGTPMPMGGPYEPIVAARLLAWLSGEENGNMTGQTIFIDGGADVVIRGDETW